MLPDEAARLSAPSRIRTQTDGIGEITDGGSFSLVGTNREKAAGVTSWYS
jgi:hypothetical protein